MNLFLSLLYNVKGNAYFIIKINCLIRGALSNNIRVEDVFKMSPKFGTATL